MTPKVQWDNQWSDLKDNLHYLPKQIAAHPESQCLRGTDGLLHATIWVWLGQELLRSIGG
jgi:hypothetical protein